MKKEELFLLDKVSFLFNNKGNSQVNKVLELIKNNKILYKETGLKTSKELMLIYNHRLKNINVGLNDLKEVLNKLSNHNINDAIYSSFFIGENEEFITFQTYEKKLI